MEPSSTRGSRIALIVRTEMNIDQMHPTKKNAKPDIHGDGSCSIGEAWPTFLAQRFPKPKFSNMEVTHSTPRRIS